MANRSSLVVWFLIRSDSFARKEPILKPSLERSEAVPAAAAPRSQTAATKHASVQSLEHVRELLGPAWIIEGEDPERYEQLLARVADAVGPADFIDWLLVKDVVAHTWEIQRSRQHRETVIRMGRLKALRQILDQATPDSRGLPSVERNRNIADLAIKWLNGDSKAAKRVAETLQASGFSLADIAAHAITVTAVELERIDLQVERYESRRDSLLRQIERRREGWEKRVLRASDDVIEAEFSEIATRDPKSAVAVGGSTSGK
jgi:hypothetical protein